MDSLADVRIVKPKGAENLHTVGAVLGRMPVEAVEQACKRFES